MNFKLDAIRRKAGGLTENDETETSKASVPADTQKRKNKKGKR